MMKKILLSCLLILLLYATVSCNDTSDDVMNNMDVLLYGSNYKFENTQVNHEYLAGMGTLFWERKENIDYNQALIAMKNLGVKSLRTWIHFKYLMIDPETIDREKADEMHKYLAKAINMGFQIIGMNHYSYHKSGYFAIGKVKRVNYENENSVYKKWLRDYETSWYTLAKEFPEITYWEIDNELNNPDFMYIDGKKDSVLTLEEMAHISADMLYYGSLGIHRANPNANTILGGLVDSLGLGLGCMHNGVHVGNMKDFLELLYDVIDSGEHNSLYYDDFFQIAAWHPYYYNQTADEYFVKENNAIYDIILRSEGKNKKVFLTEFGWKDINTQGQTAQFITDLYTILREKMPYVESLHYYLLFDDVNLKIETGLFNDPVVGGSPKESALAYQIVNNGDGTLIFDFSIKK